jgi:hypothetical protein
LGEDSPATLQPRINASTRPWPPTAAGGFPGVAEPLSELTAVLTLIPSIINKRKSSRKLSNRLRLVLLAVLCGLTFLAAGCSTTPEIPSRQLNEVLNRYPNAQEPLRIKKLTVASAAEVAPALQGRAVTVMVMVMVHPAYSLFFREEQRSAYTEAKYDLLKFQLDSEARFISEIAKTDNLLILVLPGNFQQESIAPLSYTYYLNAATGEGTSVYYITSETWSSGALSMDTMVTLYGFLRKVGATRMLIGGGYIGRCQREFHSQVSTYVEMVSPYIVPEISSASPDDISSREAQEMLVSLRQGDYTPVRKFIEKMGSGPVESGPNPAALRL